MNSTTLKQLSFLALLGALVSLAFVVQAQDYGLTVTPVTEPPASILPMTDDTLTTLVEEATEEEAEEEAEEESEEDIEEIEEILEESSDEEFMISLEDALAKFALRHRDVRRDCDEIQIDMQIQQQGGSPVDTLLQQEYLGCLNYKRELVENIVALAARISEANPMRPIEIPGPKPEAPPSPAQSRGILSGLTSRLPSIF